MSARPDKHPPRETHDRPVDDASPLPPMPVLSPLLARRLRARVLDPETAVLAPGQPVPLPTVYVSDTLLVRDVVDDGLSDAGRTRVDELLAFAKGLPDPLHLEVLGAALAIPYTGDTPQSLGGDARVTLTRVRLGRGDSQAGKMPDAWRFLQTAITAPSERATQLYDKLGLGRRDCPEPTDDAERSRRARREARARSMAGGVFVEHLLTAGGGVWGGGGGVWGGGGGVWGGGGGVWGGGGGVWGGGGLLAEYGTPGIGGRSPVVWSAPDPRLAARPGAERPVVAVLDTGLGRHDWYPEEDEGATADTCSGDCPGAHRRVGTAGAEIGLWHEPSRDPEVTGVLFDDVNGLLDSLCGHGTFVAGVVRQRCPEAVILAVPVMASDGAALEEDVLRALSQLLDRHRAAKAKPGSITHGVLDVVNLSLGYYHETPDEADDTALAALLQQFADEGIAVVCCAGNDSTRARFFPAAFARPDVDGLVGVGATNPDDRSVALFSNVGDWVTAHAPGAGVVSTVPTTLSGSLGRTVYVEGTDRGPRAGVDFDDFSSGFAVWSGTSFASPWIAGEIAAQIVATGTSTTGDEGRALSAAAEVVARANARWTEQEP
ncbi:S8 family serine peptidase [Phycicoccus sonneratiae]|uniref:S8 family serine peptidase n=1 Tax=Phycicoccus sonneratiae TaxID=2807628 RepID=A0ABS2CR45_9MICO|nr:S8 family serine peptidase [Phycicoccus sonneraticus]MBM6401606.1 S8 family serine peptidase [Phycicoccus sonneraticus]